MLSTFEFQTMKNKEKHDLANFEEKHKQRGESINRLFENGKTVQSNFSLEIMTSTKLDRQPKSQSKRLDVIVKKTPIEETTD